MNTPPANTTRENILEELGRIRLMRRGTISEQYFNRTLPDGSTVRLGPYHKFQIWQDGHNLTRRVDADEASVLRADIDNYHHFEQLCQQLAEINISHTIACRAAEPDSTSGAADKEKKTSKPNALPKNTAKQNTSSPKLGNSSAY